MKVLAINHETRTITVRPVYTEVSKRTAHWAAYLDITAVWCASPWCKGDPPVAFSREADDGTMWAADGWTIRTLDGGRA